MACEKLDQLLLLQVHGELTFLEGCRLEWHLRRCSRCQEQKAAWASVSALAANSVCEASLPPWKPRPAGSNPLRLLFGGLGVLLLLIVSLSLIFLHLSKEALFPNRNSQPGAASPAKGDCAPDLPSDRCR